MLVYIYKNDGIFIIPQYPPYRIFVFGGIYFVFLLNQLRDDFIFYYNCGIKKKDFLSRYFYWAFVIFHSLILPTFQAFAYG